MSMPDFDALTTEAPSGPETILHGRAEFAGRVREGLSKEPRELPSIDLYDAIGTALFEAITLLPEYGLTRADARLIRRFAPVVLERLPGPLLVAELGSGTGTKTRWVLEALARREPVVYFPIDVSASALHKCRQELSEIGAVSIVGMEASYLDGLREVIARRRHDQTLLVLFLGSTIGNFERAAGEEFLRDIRRCLCPGDALLLGADLEKSVEDLVRAYDDPLGVTAAFNLNLLARINRELGGDFVLHEFAHTVRYDERERRIEMHLRSCRRQMVTIKAADVSCTFQPGDTIWTEACHKFSPAEIRRMASRTGFVCEAQWVDSEWSFAENLWIADPAHPHHT